MNYQLFHRKLENFKKENLGKQQVFTGELFLQAGQLSESQVEGWTISSRLYEVLYIAISEFAIKLGGRFGSMPHKLTVIVIVIINIIV